MKNNNVNYLVYIPLKMGGKWEFEHQRANFTTDINSTAPFSNMTLSKGSKFNVKLISKPKS
jgi:hypothetical protein